VKVYFLTSSDFKIKEALDFVEWHDVKKKYGLELCVVRHDVQEILSPDILAIARQKVIGAYDFIKEPCLVQHGGLFLDALPGLPGTFGKLIWDAIGDRMCGFLRDDDPRDATVRSFLGYCDGRRAQVYVGETRGRITDRARGDYRFAWDPIFIPEGSEETYGEMGLLRKRETSPSVKAWEEFLKKEEAHLKETR
jgi:XTP/dITP diphosphohydrolase